MEKSKYLLVNGNDRIYLGFFELSPQEVDLVEEVLKGLCEMTSAVEDVYLLNLDNEEYFNPEKEE